MSIAYLTWAMDTQEPTGTARLVLFVLAEIAQDHQFEENGPDWKGVCWPSVARVAIKARASRRATFDALAWLSENGFIRTIEIEGDQRPTWFGKPITTTLRQIRGGADFAPLPVEGGAAERGEGVRDAAPKPRTEPLEEEADASPSKGPGFSSRYAEPETPGSAAAPWLVLELGRLMRENDSQAKLPVGLRELMAPEYLAALTTSWVSTDKRREMLLPALDKKSLVKWLDDMRLLIDTDQREPREIAQVLRWCQGDSFWKGNILSPSKFRKQYPALRARWQEEGGGAARPSTNGAPARGPSTRSKLDALARPTESQALWRQNGVCPWALRAGNSMIECEHSYGHQGDHSGADPHGTIAQWPSSNKDATNRETA